MLQQIDLVDAELPVFQPVAVRVTELCAEPNPSQSELIHTISLDPVLTATVLSAANTHRHVSTIEAAVKVVGVDNVCMLLLTTICHDPLRDAVSGEENIRFNMQRNWQHSLTASLCARELATLTDNINADIATIAGLCHDIGKLTLYCYDPGAYEEVLERVEQSGLVVEEAERLIFGVDHTIAGRWVLENWQLPYTFQESVWLHHYSNQSILHAGSSLDLVGCIRFANIIAHEPPFEHYKNNGHPSRVNDFLNQFHISDDQYSDLCDRVQLSVNHKSKDLPAMDSSVEEIVSFRRSVRSTLRQRIHRLGASTQTQERQLSILESLHRLTIEMLNATNISQVLNHVAHAVCQGLNLISVHSAMRLTGDEVVQGTATGTDRNKSAVATKQTTVTIDAREWGQGTLTAVYDLHMHVPDVTAWLTQFADLASHVISYIQRYQRTRQLSDQFVLATSAQSGSSNDTNDYLWHLNEMAGHMAHIFNNVFAGILGRTQLLLKYPDNQSKLVHGLQTIEQATLKGTQIIQQLQIASRTDPVSSSDSVDLQRLIETVIYEQEKNLLNHEVRVTVDFHPSTPEIWGRKEDLHAMLTHLLINAIESMEQGGNIRIITSITEDHAATLSISDEGIGIPASIRDRIFQPFFTTKGPQSIGLGLSLVRSIILRHQGEIELISEEGQGTTIKLTFSHSVQTQAIPTNGSQNLA